MEKYSFALFLKLELPILDIEIKRTQKFEGFKVELSGKVKRVNIVYVQASAVCS